MKRVLSAPNAAEAHVAVAALESAGIDGVIRGEFMGALPLGPISRPSVWVRDENYAEACKLLGVIPDAEQLADHSTTRSPMRVMLIIAVIILVLLVLSEFVR
jgi:hypothetical protein